MNRARQARHERSMMTRVFADQELAEHHDQRYKGRDDDRERDPNPSQLRHEEGLYRSNLDTAGSRPGCTHRAWLCYFSFCSRVADRFLSSQAFSGFILSSSVGATGWLYRRG